MVLGDGVPLVLLHGYGCTNQIFNLQINYFSRFFKVYAPTFSGFNAPLEKPYCLEDYKNELLDFLEQIPEDKVYVLAHSFGVRVLLKLMPYGKIQKIVLSGGAGLKPKRKITYYLKIWGYKSIKRLFGENSARKISNKTCFKGYNDLPENNKQSFIKIVNEHLDYRLKHINVPTLIIHGNKDNETPPYMARRFNSGIKNSQLVFLDGGHFLFLDNPTSFNFIVKEFLI